jgi:hypothetical protein
MKAGGYKYWKFQLKSGGSLTGISFAMPTIGEVTDVTSPTLAQHTIKGKKGEG